MSERVQIPFPQGGLSEAAALDRQPPGTTRTGDNVRLRDPVTGRFRGAQRAGSTAYSTYALGGGAPATNTTPVRSLVQVGYDKPGVTYTAASGTFTARSAEPPAKDGSRGVVTDALGNTYWLDGSSGVVKHNSDGFQVWKLTLPVPTGGKVGHLTVDSLLRVFVCTSRDTSPTKSRIWAYEQNEDNKVEQLWELQPDWSCVRLKTWQGELLVLMEDQASRDAQVVSYIGLGDTSPTQSRNWEVPSKPRDMSISPTDGAVYTAHAPDPNRGVNATDPDATPDAIVWTPDELDDFDSRCWAWFKADDVDGDGSNNSAHNDFEAIDLWRSAIKGDLRYLIPSAGGQIVVSGSGQTIADTGATLVKNAVAGRDALWFAGGNAASGQSYMSGPSSSTSRSTNILDNTIVPNYVGAQYAVFMVVKTVPQDATPRTLFLSCPGNASTGYYASSSLLLGYCGHWDARGDGSWWVNVGAYTTAEFRQSVQVQARLLRPTTNRDTGTDTFTAVNHGLQTGDLIYVCDSNFGNTGVTQQLYWVSVTGADTFQISNYPGLSPLLAVSSDQANTVHFVLRNRVSASFTASAALIDDVLDTFDLDTVFAADTEYPYTETEPVVFFAGDALATLPSGITEGRMYWTKQNGSGYNLNDSPTEDGAVNAYAVLSAASPGSGTIYCCRPQHPKYPMAGAKLSPGVRASDLHGDKMTPIVGSMDDDGAMVISWIEDGGVDDDGETPTRSQFRINGQPIERWTGSDLSAVGSDTKQYLGLHSNVSYAGAGGNPNSILERFKGYICEILVLSDRARPNTDTSSNQIYSYQRLIETPTYPNTGWVTGSETEIEKIEGYLAHKWGRAHKLPARETWSFTISATDNGDVICVDGVYYKFVTTAGSGAHAGDFGDPHEVRVGTGGGVNEERYSAQNLVSAINGNGPTDSHSPGSQHPSWKARGHYPYVTLETAYANIDDLDLSAIHLEARTADAVTVLDDNFTGTTPTGMTARGRTNFAGIEWLCRPDGDFPHPFSSTYVSGRTTGGPPRKNPWSTRWNDALTDTAGLLCKWDSNNGRLRWSLNGSSVGGVGYACAANSAGEIYSVGPRLSAATDVIKVTDAGTSYDIIGGSDAVTEPWKKTLSGGEIDTDADVWLAVDQWDNVYVPWTSSATAHTLYVLARKPSSTDTGNVLYTIPDLGDGYAAAVDPLDMPDLDPPASVLDPKRPEFVYIATSATQSMNRVRLIVTARNSGVTSQRQFKLYGVQGGTVYEVGTTTHTPRLNTVMDADAQYISGVSLFGKAYWTDGRNAYQYWNPRAGTGGELTATSANKIPPRARLLAAWRGRLVLARFQDDPDNVAMSKIGDPRNWDFLPANPTTDQAILLSNTRLGVYPDIVNCFAPYTDDLAVVGGDRFIHFLRGDPAAGGAFDLLTDDTGIAFGRAWCRDDQGRFWFFGSRGGLYTLGGSGVEEVSRTKLQKTLREIDLSQSRVELAWNHEEQSIHILVIPLSVTPALASMYCFETMTGAFWKDTWKTTAVQPTACCAVDGDQSGDRFLLWGCGDGRVRKWSAAAATDDGQFIASKVLMAPVLGPAVDVSAQVTDFEVLLDANQGAALCSVYGSRRADDLGVARAQFNRGPGDLGYAPIRVSGVIHGLEIAGDHRVAGRWALERASCAASPGGVRRPLP